MKLKCLLSSGLAPQFADQLRDSMTLIDFCLQHNLTELPVPDGNIHRFSVGNSKNKNGWYVFHNTNGFEHITIGDWKSDTRYSWSNKKKLNDDEKQLIENQVLQAQIQREKEKSESQKQTALVAQQMWNEAGLYDISHPYLARKQIKSTTLNIKQLGQKLLVPIFDGDVLVNIQTIGIDGQKLFLPGGKISGCAAPISLLCYSRPHAIKRFYLGEGMATGATIFEATNEPVWLAFTAQNLKRVYERLVQDFPDHEIIIIADNDHKTTRPPNPGLTKAKEIQQQYGAKVIAPFGIDGTDFNDMLIEKGMAEVQSYFDTEPDSLETITQPPPFTFINEKGKEAPDFNGVAGWADNTGEIISDSGNTYIYDDHHFKLLTKNQLMAHIDSWGGGIHPSQIGQFLVKIQATTDLCLKRQTIDSLREKTNGKINLANGVLHIDSCELRKHSKKYFFSYKLPHNFEPDSKCPKFDAFLDDILCGNQDDIATIWELFGYIIEGKKPWLHRAVVLYGDGANGKSVLISVLEKLIGKHNFSTVSPLDLGKPFTAIGMVGKLANIVHEWPKVGIDSDTFKRTISGESLNVSYKHQNEFTINPICKWLIASNGILTFKGDNSTGIHRRVQYVYFENNYEARADHTIWTRFDDEMAGIINKSLEGLKRLKAQGSFTESDRSKILKNEAIRENDSVVEWVTDELDFNGQTDKKWSIKSLFKKYQLWCDESNRRPVNKINFGRKLNKLLNEHGIEQQRDRDNRFYVGFTVRTYILGVNE